MEKSKEVKVFACGYCGKLYREKTNADFCHNDKTCGTCGKVVGKTDYYIDCKECRDKKEEQKEKERFDKAAKLSYKEYEKDCEGYLFVNDEIYYFIEDLEDAFEEDMPKYAWAASMETKGLISDDLVEDFESSLQLDDYQLQEDAVKKIEDFCRNWNEVHGVDVYYPDYSRAVILD